MCKAFTTGAKLVLRSSYNIICKLTCTYIYMSYSLCYFLFDLILYVPSTIFQLNRDGSSWVKLVLS